MKNLIALTILFTVLNSTTAHAENPSGHASKASKHSVLASTNGVTASGQIASAVAAVPLVVIGSTAVASIATAESLAKSASKYHHEPKHILVITDITVTADRSPAQTMNNPTQQ